MTSAKKLGRPRTSRTHCINGHLLTEENSVSRTQGKTKYIVCKACVTASRIKHQEKVKLRRFYYE